MATLTVTTTNDVVDETDGVLSLREAIALAEASASDDVIEFDASLAGEEINLQSTLVISAGSGSAGKLTIDGDTNGDGDPDLVISGDRTGNGRSSDDVMLFEVQADTDVVLRSLELSDGYSQPLGYGDSAVSAIDNQGYLVIEDSVLSDNIAFGYYGGIYGYTDGGSASTIRNNGFLAITDSAFERNEALGGRGAKGGYDGSPGYAGGDVAAGVLNSGTVFGDNVLFTQQTATGGQGGNGGVAYFAGNGGDGGNASSGIANTATGTSIGLFGQTNNTTNVGEGGQGGFSYGGPGFTGSNGADGIRDDLALGGGTQFLSDGSDAFSVGAGTTSGNDTITGTDSREVIHGLSGNDRIFAGDGADIVFGGTGNDRVEDGQGDDIVMLGKGNDYVRVGGGEDSFDGGTGIDYISYFDAPNGVTVNLRTDTVSGSSANDDTISNFESISGSRTGDDVIFGTTVTDDAGGDNVIRTYGGNDDVYDYSGDDTVELGDGRDFVRVGGGTDSFDGGDGIDYISYFGSSGGVRLDFENDTAALSWARDDTVVNFESASGSNTGDDDLRGDEADTVFRGNGGNDRLLGRDGDDTLYGGRDDDRLFGGNDNDELYGESGNDFLHGGRGNDSLTGGSGIDTFHFDRGDGDVTVLDFENNFDVFQFDNFSGPETSSNQAFFDAYVRQQGNDVVFDFGADGTLTVADTTIGLVRNDFELV